MSLMKSSFQILPSFYRWSLSNFQSGFPKIYIDIIVLFFKKNLLVVVGKRDFCLEVCEEGDVPFLRIDHCWDRLMVTLKVYFVLLFIL